MLERSCEIALLGRFVFFRHHVVGMAKQGNPTMYESIYTIHIVGSKKRSILRISFFSASVASSKLVWVIASFSSCEAASSTAMAEGLGDSGIAFGADMIRE